MRSAGAGGSRNGLHGGPQHNTLDSSQKVAAATVARTESIFVERHLLVVSVFWGGARVEGRNGS